MILSDNEYSYYLDIKAMPMFLHGMHLNGRLCSGLSASRSALYSVIATNGYRKLLKHPLLSRYLRKIWNSHSSVSKYMDIWDVTNILLSHNHLDHN